MYKIILGGNYILQQRILTIQLPFISNFDSMHADYDFCLTKQVAKLTTLIDQ